MARLGIIQTVPVTPAVHARLQELSKVERRHLAAIAGFLIEYGLHCMDEKQVHLSEILSVLPVVEKPVVGRKKKET